MPNMNHSIKATKTFETSIMVLASTSLKLMKVPPVSYSENKRSELLAEAQRLRKRKQTAANVLCLQLDS